MICPRFIIVGTSSGVGGAHRALADGARNGDSIEHHHHQRCATFLPKPDGCLRLRFFFFFF